MVSARPGHAGISNTNFKITIFQRSHGVGVKENVSSLDSNQARSHISQLTHCTWSVERLINRGVENWSTAVHSAKWHGLLQIHTTVSTTAEYVLWRKSSLVHKQDLNTPRQSRPQASINRLALELFFFLILAHPVYKM